MRLTLTELLRREGNGFLVKLKYIFPFGNTGIKRKLCLPKVSQQLNTLSTFCVQNQHMGPFTFSCKLVIRICSPYDKSARQLECHE